MVCSQVGDIERPVIDDDGRARGQSVDGCLQVGAGE